MSQKGHRPALSLSRYLSSPLLSTRCVSLFVSLQLYSHVDCVCVLSPSAPARLAAIASTAGRQQDRPLLHLPRVRVGARRLAVALSSAAHSFSHEGLLKRIRHAQDVPRHRNVHVLARSSGSRSQPDREPRLNVVLTTWPYFFSLILCHVLVDGQLERLRPRSLLLAASSASCSIAPALADGQTPAPVLRHVGQVRVVRVILIVTAFHRHEGRLGDMIAQFE